MGNKFNDVSETFAYSKIEIGPSFVRKSMIQRPSIDPNSECGFKERKNSNQLALRNYF